MSIAIIGGTGLTQLNGLELIKEASIKTPYGEPSAALVCGQLAGAPVVFLARHGSDHSLLPYRINYRANLWALKQQGITDIIAVAAVGGIRADMQAAQLVIPHQIIDYTSSREHTFFDQDQSPVTHIDFSEPYCQTLRQLMIDSLSCVGISAAVDGVYAATQGPRLETVAEIDRLARDGCDLVGMTGMPEAALARELGLNYACCAVIANLAAGRGERKISMQQIQANLAIGMAKVNTLLEHLIPRFSAAADGQ